jgi:RNA polymerase sigma factor (sigma-70 family)
VTDAELVERTLAGDRDAFGALAERHRPMARRIAMGMVHSADTAREMASEAILQAYLSLDRLQRPERFQSWLHGIVLNVCRAHLRDRGRAPLSLEEIMGGLRFEAIPLGSVEPDPQEAVEAKDLHRIVHDAVEALPPKSRAATLLFYYDQLTVREVAATLDVSVSAIKVRLHSARNRLRETLLSTHEPAVRPEKQQQEEQKMIEVEIADVIATESKDEKTGQTSSVYVVVLLDETGRRVLPIWIGPTEGRSIAIELRQVELPRPMTVTFMARLMDAADAKIEQVRIERLVDDTYFAVVQVRRGDETREVDARPSDALALAAHAGCQIFAAEDILARAAKTVPPGDTQIKPDGKGLDTIAAPPLRDCLDQRVMNSLWRRMASKPSLDSPNNHSTPSYWT